MCFPPIVKGWVTRRGIWEGQKLWEVTEIFCVNPPTTSLNLRCKIQNINNHQTVTQKTDSVKLKLKTNTNAFQVVVSTAWFVFHFFFGWFPLYNLVRSVPALGRKDKAFMVPMIHLRLYSPQGCLEGNLLITEARNRC